MSDKTSPHTFPSNRLQATAATSPRRTTHSASGWTLPSGLQALRQPQDGALTNGGSNAQVLVRSIDNRSSNPLREAEDARLNGSLRSLARRVKGLNVMAAPLADASRQNSYSSEPSTRKTPEISRKGVATRTQVA